MDQLKTATPPLRRPAALIRNRRAINWGLENAPWTPGKAARHVVEQLTGWGYCGTKAQRDQAAAVTQALTTAALADGGKRVSVHLADQDGHALIMVLSHRADTVPDEAFLTEISALGAASCGSDVNRDDSGNQRWALIEVRR
jgi:hypothetical protein